MTRILIVAPSAVVRAGLESILAARTTLSVVGSISGIADLPRAIEELDPDVVLLDLEGGEQREGMAPIPQTGEGGPAFVVLAAAADNQTVSTALRLGARAVLPRGALPEEIITAIEAVAAGLLVLHPRSAGPLMPLLTTAEPPSSLGTETLTSREIEVLTMLAEGSGNKQIARQLGISDHTVKFHVGSILAKLGAGSRTEAVTLGVRHGLIMV